MAKKTNFLLIDINDKKTKKLAETITSSTSRKILDYLTEKEDSEANIAKATNIPISTVHYHLQKLKEAGLIIVEEFHYSKKGREIDHYKLANKYIIIAPKSVKGLGLKQKLKGILPIAIIALGISAVIKVITSPSIAVFEKTAPVRAFAEEAVMAAAPEVMEMPVRTVSQQPDIALWFFVGSIATIIIYLVVGLIKDWLKKR